MGYKKKVKVEDEDPALENEKKSDSGHEEEKDPDESSPFWEKLKDLVICEEEELKLEEDDDDEKTDCTWQGFVERFRHLVFKNGGDLENHVLRLVVTVLFLVILAVLKHFGYNTLPVFLIVFVAVFVYLTVIGCKSTGKQSSVKLAFFLLCFFSTLYYYIVFSNVKLNLLEELFYSFAIFFGDKAGGTEGIGIDVLKFFSRISLIALLFNQVKDFVVLLNVFVEYLLGKTVYVVHGDKEYLNKIKENYSAYEYRRIVIVDRKDESFYDFAKIHILLYNNETENMDECVHLMRKSARHEKKIYMSVTKMEPSFYNIPDVTAFSFKERIAREFCIDYVNDIFSDPSKEDCFVKKIGIVGKGELPEKMLKTMIGNFVFDCKENRKDSCRQKIEYYVFNDSDKAKALLKRLHTWNYDEKTMTYKDNVLATEDVIHIQKPSDIYSLKEEMDAVILSDEDASLNEELFSSLRNNRKLFIYNPSFLEEAFPKKITFMRNLFESVEQGPLYKIEKGNIFFFGCENILLDMDAIVSDKVLEKAKEINASYHKKDFTSKDVMWNQCTAYEIRSSLASAIHKIIMEELPEYTSKERLSYVEHARWVRFMELDGWRYAEETDKENKFHKDIKYGLDEKEKNKDRNIVGAKEKKTRRK